MTSKERRQQRYLKKMLENSYKSHTDFRNQTNNETSEKITKMVQKKMKEERLMKEKLEEEKKKLSPTNRLRHTFWTKE